MYEILSTPQPMILLAGVPEARSPGLESHFCHLPEGDLDKLLASLYLTFLTSKMVIWNVLQKVGMRTKWVNVFKGLEAQVLHHVIIYMPK